MDETAIQQAALEGMMADPAFGGEAMGDPFAAAPPGGMVTITVPEWALPAIAELLSSLEGGALEAGAGGMPPMGAPPMM